MAAARLLCCFVPGRLSSRQVSKLDEESASFPDQGPLDQMLLISMDAQDNNVSPSGSPFVS